MMASVFFRIYSFPAANHFHFYHLSGINSWLEAALKVLKIALSSGRGSDKQQVEAGESNYLLGVKGQP